MSRSATSRVPMGQGQIPLENHIFRDFGGINTQPARQAVGNNEFAWLENIMPIGHGNLRTVQQISAVVATIPGSRTIYYREFYNITGVDYLFCACTDGSAYQVAMDSPYTVTQIAAAGTFSGSATQIAQWKNERILIIDTNATGYRDWNGVTLTTLSGTTGAPDTGTLIATYAGRVWIVTGSSPSRTIAYSAANSYVDFTGTGGSTTITDETLTSAIYQFLVANNFLYFFGVDSINVIADVQVSGGVTLFSNTNIVANSGTTFAAVVPFYRSVWYMNKAGIFALYGATPRKVSDPLDGVFDYIDFTQPITAGSVTLYNELCLAFLFTYNDPTEGPRQLFAIFYDKKWFLASQSTDVDGIATRNFGLDQLWGTAGDSVYIMFDDDESDVDQYLSTRLWDFEDFISIKEAIRVGLEVYTPDTTGGVTLSVDSERYTVSPTNPFNSSFSFTWYNSTGATFSWLNSLGASFTWLTSGYVWLQSDIEIQGHYLGITMTSTTAQNIYEGFQLQFRRLPAGWGA